MRRSRQEGVGTALQPEGVAVGVMGRQGVAALAAGQMKEPGLLVPGLTAIRSEAP